MIFFSDCSTTVTCNACPTNRQHHHSTRLQSPKWYIVTGLRPSGHAGRSGRRPTAFGRCPYRGSQVWHWVKFLKNTSKLPGPPCPPRDLTSFRKGYKNNRAKKFYYHDYPFWSERRLMIYMRCPTFLKRKEIRRKKDKKYAWEDKT